MERLQQIEEIFQEALQRDPAQRDSYVRQACGGNIELQREVISLLANHDKNSDFQPWAAAAAAQLIGTTESLKPGHSLGPYRIESFLAAGGMGEVYRAIDTRLNRPVAIKVSTERFTERFEREARVIASLNHPNICQLYDVGPNYLVMELVEGENLSGPLPVETALHYARQITEALEAAHEKGIVHRDLKPANVKITPAGAVKVLDFGLAKAFDSARETDTSNSPTQTISATRTGVILGTAAYMSPEQARGAAVDKRADIWAFGCVLYEMLSGKRAFQGDTTSDILAAVLKEEPDWSGIPSRARPLLRRCLVKDPKHRLRDIGDAMSLLDNVAEPRPVRQPWPWVAAAALAIVVAIVLAVGLWRATRPAPLPRLVRVSVELSPDTTVVRSRGGQLALSPDGTRIAIIEQDAAGKFSLATRQLEQSEFVTLSGTEGANMPFFSPDGQWIGFFADGKLKKIAVQGGFPVTLCDAPGPNGASWGDDDKIIAALNLGSGFSRIPSGGVAPAPVKEVNREKSALEAFPQVLPGSEAVLFTSTRAGSYGDIDVLSFKTGERKTLHRGGRFGRYLPSGHLVYMQQNTLFAAPFDLSRLAVTGAPQPVLEDISRASGLGVWSIDFSQTGTIVYVSGKATLERAIFWLDSTGKTQPLHVTPGVYFFPHFSPDGKRLAFQMDTYQGRDVWVKDLERGTTSRLTSVPGPNGFPMWTADGTNIVFHSSNPVAPGLYSIRADGSDEPQRLTDGSTTGVPNSFSTDGKRVAYQLGAYGHGEIWTGPVQGDPEHPRLGKAEPFLRTPSDETAPAFSPDGRWLAYSSNETGTDEVYVRPFPGPGAVSHISSGGGRWPIWSHNGRELFFLNPDQRIMVADYTAKGDSFAARKPELWSPKSLLVAFRACPYDLAPDGKRFAVVLYADGTAEQKPITHVTVLLNFFDELKRRVPAGGK